MKRYQRWLPESGLKGRGGAGLELHDVHFTIDAQTASLKCELCLPVKSP